MDSLRGSLGKYGLDRLVQKTNLAFYPNFMRAYICRVVNVGTIEQLNMKVVTRACTVQLMGWLQS